MSWFRKTAPTDPLAVTMAGVTLGNRVFSVGTADVQLMSALAIKAGLTGQAAAVEADPARVALVQKTFEQHGALVDVSQAPFSALPFEAGSFDVAILADMLPGLELAERQACLRDVLRVLRDGGRAVIVERTPRGRFGKAPAFAHTSIDALKSAGFGAARILAERDGALFAEAVKRSS